MPKTQFIWVSVGVLELLHRHSPSFLQLELQISHLFILQLTKIFLHLNTLLQGRNMFFVILSPNNKDGNLVL